MRSMLIYGVALWGVSAGWYAWIEHRRREFERRRKMRQAWEMYRDRQEERGK